MTDRRTADPSFRTGPTGGGAGDAPRVIASPAARRVAAERGLDLTRVVGRGPEGRIVLADLDDAAGPEAFAHAAHPSADRTPAPEPPPVQDSTPFVHRRHRRVPLDAMRRAIADRVTQAIRTVPQFNLRRDIRADALLGLRRDANLALAPRGDGLSVNDLVIRACALALQDVPEANAVWDRDGILRLEASDIAVAVAGGGGLFLPVLRDAEGKNLPALAREMRGLAAEARAGNLSAQACTGGSLAISNLGMFGVQSFDALLSPPQSAILSVGACTSRAVILDGGTPGVAQIMSLTLGIDHRVMDGALGARLLDRIAFWLEHPAGMLV